METKKACRTETLGSRIQEARRTREMTLSQLAQQTGLSLVELSGIENDRRYLPDDAIAKMSAALGLPLELFHALNRRVDQKTLRLVEENPAVGRLLETIAAGWSPAGAAQELLPLATEISSIVPGGFSCTSHDNGVSFSCELIPSKRIVV